MALPHQYLRHRSVIRLHGEDTTSFLQNLVTANIENLDRNSVTPCALLTPQGKIAFDFLIGTTGHNDFFIDIREDLVETFKKRIQLYKLRADVFVEDPNEYQVSVIWSEDVENISGLKDLRFPDEADVYRLYEPTSLESVEGSFDEQRVRYGVAESGSDFELNDIFPHDIYYDLNNAIDFKKGCYVGQEVISRMQHRGSARKRVCVVSADNELQNGEQNITTAGKTIGQLGTVINTNGLGIIRVDRLLSAQESNEDILVGNTKVLVSFPKWVGDRYIPVKVEPVI